jgi:hypothetical protein
VSPQEVDGFLDRRVPGNRSIGHLGDEHVQQPTFPRMSLVDCGRDRISEEAEVRADALLVVDMEQPTHRPPDDGLGGPWRKDRRAGSLPEVGPALGSVVDVVEVESGLVQEAGEVGVGDIPAQ